MSRYIVVGLVDCLVSNVVSCVSNYLNSRVELLDVRLVDFRLSLNGLAVDIEA